MTEESDDPPWLSAFDDLTEAAAMVLEESARQEGRAIVFDLAAAEDVSAPWQERAAEAREQARILNRAAAILDWVGRRADRLHLLAKPRPWSELMQQRKP